MISKYSINVLKGTPVVTVHKHPRHSMRNRQQVIHYARLERIRRPNRCKVRAWQDLMNQPAIRVGLDTVMEDWFTKQEQLDIGYLPSVKVASDWLPTAANINALPLPLRNYIHDLITNADPAGMVCANIFLKDQVHQLEFKLNQIREQLKE